MVVFFENKRDEIFAVQFEGNAQEGDIAKLIWLLDGDKKTGQELSGFFIGPRREIVSPWSTNAVEITQNMGISNILRIEKYRKVSSSAATHDSMLEIVYEGLDQNIFLIEIEPDDVIDVEDIRAYNIEEGLALSDSEVDYLIDVSKRIGRKLTDSEVFGFSQVNSEHCRHKIFNGDFVIDGKKKEESLFSLIRKTSAENPNSIVSAYSDNVSFVRGPKVKQFAPASQDKADYFELTEIDTVLSLKAETHNFPTTVEPFNGAATGSGGEIRDRMAGGQGSIPLAGTAVYMTAYPRFDDHREWVDAMKERDWLYQSPIEILIKASNGASDFGNKFGQPLINGSLLTFEHTELGKTFGYDKVIMQAGGIGFGKMSHALKHIPKKGDKIVVLGGDNYRIGMGGSAVSSVATGEYNSGIELNAIQRSNPEMQKRVANVIRALAESSNNPIISIHDHGAGGHLNCLSELVEDVGGTIDLRKLPIGDKTLSAKEIIGNESQERMGIVIDKNDLSLLDEICKRERAPMYIVGEVTGDYHFKFEDVEAQHNPIDLQIADMFGRPPKTVISDNSITREFDEILYDIESFDKYLESVLQLESVACKDWLTNKVDRSVTGRVAKQQTVGEIQLPLSNLGVVALDYTGQMGVAVSTGHAPIVGLLDEVLGSRMAIAEALTNIVWAPLDDGLKSVSLSANWMWPSKNEGEDARLYSAVEAVSEFACDLGINIPTGKDSLSMVQKYSDKSVYAPGTVIITASGSVSDIRKVVEPVIVNDIDTAILYIDFSGGDFELGGSAFGQILNKLGEESPLIEDASYFAHTFDIIQELIKSGKVLAGHDISSGGLITTLLEMNFPNVNGGLNIDLGNFDEDDIVKLLFSEKPGVIIQVKDGEDVFSFLKARGIKVGFIGQPIRERKLNIQNREHNIELDIDYYRDIWYKTSYLFDRFQSTKELAKERFDNYGKLKLDYIFPDNFSGRLEDLGLSHDRNSSTGIKAAIIREKGVNGDREMAYSLFLAGFDVKDIHMTDLISGKEDLSDINMIVFVGGFSNSDVLGSAKGWAGAFLYNPRAKESLDKFYERKDTLSLGVCNGCQLMMELGLVENEGKLEPMAHNDSHKYESGYINVDIPKNNSVMLSSLQGSKLGIWIAHGEGKFVLNDDVSRYNIALKYSSALYPANPNGSDYNTAGICSIDGRHLAMMPHLERIVFPWQGAHYKGERKMDEVTPWLEAFVNAIKWVEKSKEAGIV